IAHAYDDVVYDGVNESGTHSHATGNKGTFTKDIHEIVMEGMVHATTQDPNEEKPNAYDGEKWTYNSQSGQSHLARGDRQAPIVTPGANRPKKAQRGPPPADGTARPNGAAPANGPAPKKPAPDPKKPAADTKKAAVPADKKSGSDSAK